MEEVITSEPLADASQLNAPDGGEADTANSISLDVLKEKLGKEFPDVETALKSIKDTFSYVGDTGKVKQVIADAKTRLNTDDQGVLKALEKLTMSEPTNIEPQAQPQASTGLSAADVEAIISQKTEEASFFAKNEALADYKDVLGTLKNANDATRNMSWSDFVATDTAKKIVEPVIGYKEEQAKKSVLESNPRLGVATDKISEAKTALKEAMNARTSGDVAYANQLENNARQNAVSSVIEAYGLK